MAFDYGMPNLRTGRPTVDAALFLRVADLLVKRHLAAEGRDVPQSIAERYFGMVPRTHIREIADKYTDIPPDDMAISRITHLLGRLSDEQVLTLVPRLIDPDQVTEPLATAARHFLKLPAAMAKHVVARRLGTLPEPKLDPVALKFLQTVPETEIRGFVQRLLRMPNKPPHHLGWMDQFDGIRPWPQSMGFLNAALTHFLTSSGFTSVDDVHLKTDAKIVHLKLPSQIFLALQFSLAARGVIFDRHNLHNLENGSIAFAPNRTKLEKLASFALTA